MPDLLTDVEKFPHTAILSDRVQRILGLNPSAFTGPGTNTYLIGAGGRDPLLIDTGSGKEAYTELLRGHLAEQGVTALSRCLLTHIHPDHIGGAEDLRGIFPGVPIHKYPWPGLDEEYESLAIIEMADGERIEGDGYSIVAIHTPGHARDHLCFYLEEEKALFTGDVVLGVGTTVIPAETGDLRDYLETLRRLQKLDLERIYPGHGPVVEEPQEKLAAYLAHRVKREGQVLAELEAAAGAGKGSMEIVLSIYRDYPAHLHKAAEQSILSNLIKLEREGRVRRIAGDPERFDLTSATTAGSAAGSASKAAGAQGGS